MSAVAIAVATGRRHRRRRRLGATGALAVIVLALFAATLMIGNTFYGPDDVWRVLMGQSVAGASFAVGELRLPRAVLAVLTGSAFGLAGISFQTLLRNPLAAPDVIGISSGASAAAVYAIVTLSLSEGAVSALAVVAALATASVIYVLAYRDGLVGARLILVGIAVSAMLDSVVAYVIVRAANWDLQAAMRWLTGSLNSAQWSQVRPLLLAGCVLVPVLGATARSLDLLRHGDDTARALGVRVERTRFVVVIAAVGLVAFATAAAGPIAFVGLLAGPIATRLVGNSTVPLCAAALVGAIIVLAADLAGQRAFGTRYPVGVLTGALGAPYLVFLLVTSQRGRLS